MNYKKIIQKPRKTVRLNSFFKGVDSINDDMVANLNSAKECYNFDSSTGALTPLTGFAEVFLKPFTGYWLVAQNSGYSMIDGRKFYSAVFVDDKGKLMTYDFDENGNAGDLYEVGDDAFHFTSKPQMIEYKEKGEDAMLFSSPTDGLVTWRGGAEPPEQIKNAPLITSMAKHSERLFVTVAGRTDKVWFSDVLDPTNWNVSLQDAGYIGFSDERGECEKVLAFGGYVYVFRAYGISRITAYGDQAEFVVEHVFSSGSRICPSSVTLCANRVIFASDDGLFSFNGSSVTKIMPLLSPLLKFGKNTTTAFYKGKFYLATEMLTEGKIGCENGQYKNNVMIVYDLYTDKYYLYRGIDVRGIFPLLGVGKVYIVVGNTLKLCEMNYSNVFDGEILERKWRSPVSDFGNSEKKTLKELSVCTDYDITVRVYSDDEVIERKVAGKSGRSVVPINLTSYTFCIEFVSNDYSCRIASPTLIYY
ncbi:MAG: hypothetical protein E7353_07965 [Clostridiales bacterium]|nr:hypothetical protein [Clostridiales bacterium]